MYGIYQQEASSGSLEEEEEPMLPVSEGVNSQFFARLQANMQVLL